MLFCEIIKRRFGVFPSWQIVVQTYSRFLQQLLAQVTIQWISGAFALTVYRAICVAVFAVSGFAGEEKLSICLVLLEIKSVSTL